MSNPAFDRTAVLARARDLGIEIANDVAIDIFGDSPYMAAELGALVRDGRKTATASLLWCWEAEGEQPPQPGDREVVVDWDGAVMAVIETTEVRVIPFDQVGAEFARDEGEGDLSLEYWRRVHWKFFACECEQLEREPTQSMPIVCQRFRLLVPL